MTKHTQTQIATLLLTFATLADQGALRQRRDPQASKYNERRAKTFRWAADDLVLVGFNSVAEYVEYIGENLTSLFAPYAENGLPFGGLSANEVKASYETLQEAARLVAERFLVHSEHVALTAV